MLQLKRSSARRAPGGFEGGHGALLLGPAIGIVTVLACATGFRRAREASTLQPPVRTCEERGSCPSGRHPRREGPTPSRRCPGGFVKEDFPALQTPAAALAESTLLIVDDLPENLSVLGELLSGAHYRVRAANSGLSALRLAAQHPAPDLILLDVMMPGMDGYEVVGRLRADPATRDIPVIFLTALSRGGRRAARAGTRCGRLHHQADQAGDRARPGAHAARGQARPRRSCATRTPSSRPRSRAAWSESDLDPGR